MAFSRALCASLGLAIGLGCTSVPSRPPPNLVAGGSVIGIAVRIDLPFQPDQHAQWVWLERLDERASGDGLIRSNYSNGGYVYLFDAGPGLYAFVAAGYV